ncbi:MAG: PD40 domain-containing protein [Planctomycetes bacterium]|nr:PD40 domain-containing protein [Planctomycetota bacterium]
MTLSGYYRYPTIHGDTIVFVSEDDLWTVPVSGGPARRLTSGVGMASHPCFSPDGSLVAFSGSEEGIREVYVMEARGGPARRLTFLGDEAWVVAWTPDRAEVVFATSSDQPFAKVFWLQAVPVAGGPARLLPHGPARNVAFGPAGGQGGSGGEALPPGRQEGRGEAEGAKPPRGGAEARDGRSADLSEGTGPL